MKIAGVHKSTNVKGESEPGEPNTPNVERNEFLGASFGVSVIFRFSFYLSMFTLRILLIIQVVILLLLLVCILMIMIPIIISTYTLAILSHSIYSFCTHSLNAAIFSLFYGFNQFVEFWKEERDRCSSLNPVNNSS